MFTKVSVLIPTRGRVERLKVLLDSYERTVRGDEEHSELVFRVDDDDPETRDFLTSAYRPYVRDVLVGPRRNGYASLTSFFNDLVSSAAGDVLMCGNDDMAFKSGGWASAILAEANKHPDGLFDIGVSVFNADHYPWCIVSRRVAQYLGFVWDPRIFWGDIYLRDVMGAFGRLKMLSDVVIDHDWAGHAPDKVFQEAKQHEIFERDPTYWAVTHRTAVEEAVARLRELQARPSVHLCIPVLKRYDLLKGFLDSVRAGTLQPSTVHVIDNGHRLDLVAEATQGFATDVFTPTARMGLAEAWNWFARNVPEERVICNDDLIFPQQALERIVGTKGDFVSALAGSNACSCFVLRDSCIEKVGLFDETISPGYAYYEDCDYVERMIQRKVRITAVEAGVIHLGSQTLAKNDAGEWNEHHRLFAVAQQNFIKKWGRMPDVNRPGLYD